MFTIYKATHVPTGKVYVGQTKKPLKVRMGQHWAEYRLKTKFLNFLHSTEFNDWTWEILHVVETYKEARDCELYYINLWNLYNVGLNSKTGYSDANHREKSSKRMKEYKQQNPEPWNKGRKGCFSEETLEKMRLAKLEKPSRPKYTEQDKINKSLQAKNSKQIIELKSGTVYRSISHAAKCLGIRRECVRDVVNGRRSHTAGYVFQLVSGA